MAREQAIEFPAMKPKSWPIEKIVPHPMNPRTHPPAQVSLLAQMFKAVGVDQPIVVDEKGIILKGHGRLLAAVEAKMKTFPVVQHFGLSEEEKIALRIQDNQVALLSGWDTDLVRSQIAQLDLAGFELTQLGFGEAQLVEFKTQPGPPGEFAAFGENIPTEYCCPKCKFRWSGKPDGDGVIPPKANGKARPKKKAAKKR